jgi:Glycosyltransferase family 87
MRLVARLFVFASSLLIILYGILPGFFRLEGIFIPFYVVGKNFLGGINPISFYRIPDFQRLIDSSGLSTRIFSIGGSTPASFLIDAVISIPPAGFSKFILTAINLGALVLLVHVSAKLARSPVKTAYLVFLSSSFALATNFSSVEPFIILSLLFTTAFFSFSIKAERAAGTILGAVFPFEPFAAIPALLFLLAKKWRPFIYFMLMSLFLLLIVYLVIGATVVNYYLQRVFPFYFNGKIQNPFSISHQTAWSFLRRVFLFDPTLNPHPILSSRDSYVFLISFFKAFVVVPSAYFFYRGVEKQDTRESFVAATFPVIFLSPTAATPQLVLLAPAIICLGQIALEEQRFTIARLFVALYALACLPVFSLMSDYLNLQSPFLIYERFFLLLSIYVVYLLSQVRLLSKHLIVIRMSMTAATIAAVAVTLYVGDSTPEPTRTLHATPVLAGGLLQSAAFSPTIRENQFAFINSDSTAQNYVVNESYLSEGDRRPSIISIGQDPPGNFYHVSFDESGKVSAVETTDGDRNVVIFKTGMASKSYRGRSGSVSRDGNLGAFIRQGSLFVVDLRSRQFPIVDSVNLLPFRIRGCSFDGNRNSLEIVFVIDSLNGSNSIGSYDLVARRLETFRTSFPVSLLSTDGKKFYVTFNDGDSTSVWCQRGNERAKELFAIHGNIIDISAVNHDLYFSSDFERGLGLPTIYKFPVKE